MYEDGRSPFSKHFYSWGAGNSERIKTFSKGRKIKKMKKMEYTTKDGARASKRMGLGI